MIVIENLYKNYGSVEVLRDINLTINRGEVVSIIGPSGTGKSTLLRTLNLLEEPTEGKIEIGGQAIQAKKIHKKQVLNFRRKSAMVFQNYNLFRNKTALENITEALIMVKNIEKKEADEIGYDILEKIGLREKYDSYPHELSGGQQQRVGIGRAMALGTEVILFDEPTSSLDPELVGEVLNLIKKIRDKNKSMIIVSHEISFVREISDKVIFMDEGRVLEYGTPEQVLLNPKNVRVKEFLDKIL